MFHSRQLTHRVCKVEHGVSVLDPTPALGSAMGLLAYGVLPLGRAVEKLQEQHKGPSEGKLDSAVSKQLFGVLRYIRSWLWQR